MTADVLSVSADTGLKAAARLMVERHISGLPVVDEERKLVGIITEADFVKQEAGRTEHRYRRLLDALFGERETRPTGETVGDAMTRQPRVVDADAPIAEAAREMTERGIKRLPVVDIEGHLVGIISRADIMRAFARSDGSIVEQVRSDVLERVLLVDPDAVTVDAVDGHVSLSGSVPTRTDVRLLEELVRRLEGVVGVDCDVRWDVDDTRPPTLSGRDD